jgi:hypothetical protein
MLLGNELCPQTPIQILYCIMITYFGAFLVAIVFGQMAAITAESNKTFDASD